MEENKDFVTENSAFEKVENAGKKTADKPQSDTRENKSTVKKSAVKNGKNEKKVTKARQLKVSFTVTQNNSTPAGMKQMYVRITGPEGSLLGQSGTFSFEGGHVAYTAHKSIEYSGQEVPVTLYYNVNTTLNPGQYTVEVFDGRYRLGSRSFVFSK